MKVIVLCSLVLACLTLASGRRLPQRRDQLTPDSSDSSESSESFDDSRAERREELARRDRTQRRPLPGSEQVEISFDELIAYLSADDQEDAIRIHNEIEGLEAQAEELRDIFENVRELRKELGSILKNAHFEISISNLTDADQESARLLQTQIKTLLGDGTVRELSSDDVVTYRDLMQQLRDLLPEKNRGDNNRRSRKERPNNGRRDSRNKSTTEEERQAMFEEFLNYLSVDEQIEAQMLKDNIDELLANDPYAQMREIHDEIRLLREELEPLLREARIQFTNFIQSKIDSLLGDGTVRDLDETDMAIYRNLRQQLSQLFRMDRYQNRRQDQRDRSDGDDRRNNRDQNQRRNQSQNNRNQRRQRPNSEERQAEFEELLSLLSEDEQLEAQQLRGDIENIVANKTREELFEFRDELRSLHMQLEKILRKARFERNISELSDIEKESAILLMQQRVDLLNNRRSILHFSQEDRDLLRDINMQLRELLPKSDEESQNDSGSFSNEQSESSEERNMDRRQDRRPDSRYRTRPEPADELTESIDSMGDSFESIDSSDSDSLGSVEEQTRPPRRFPSRNNPPRNNPPRNNPPRNNPPRNNPPRNDQSERNPSRDNSQRRRN